MPKQQAPLSRKLNNFVKTFGYDVFSTDGKVLLCKLCSIKVNHEKKFFIQQHIQKQKHQQTVILQKQEKAQAISLFTVNIDRNNFFSDLTKMMLACDIPLFKIKRQEFQSFFEEYTKKQKLPYESTLRKIYINDCYREVLQEIRLDETTDKAGRCIANVVIGPLRKDGRGYLLTCEVLKKVNSSTIATLFDDALRIHWPEEVKREKVLLFVTDAAPYMKKSGVSLKILYPKIIHVTCVAHGLHRVCETIRSKFPNVDALVSNMKKTFSKSASRLALFREKEPDLPLPPQPVLTRWGTWLNAVSYYAQNFTSIKRIFNELTDDAACIGFTKTLLETKTVQADLAYIHSNFEFLVDPEEHIFESLQKRDQQIGKTLTLLTGSTRLQKAKGSVSKAVIDKFNQVFSANKGLQIIREINNVINGVESCCLPDNIDVDNVENFNWAPLVSADVERTFSTFKSTLRDNRNRLLPVNFKAYMVVQCYYNKI